MKTSFGLVKSLAPGRPVRWAGLELLNWLFPPVCLACQAPLVGADTLCPSCFLRLIPITQPFCPILGLPFAYDMGEGARSAQAIADPPPFARARSALVYNDLARDLVARFKYGDRPELARFCARAMVTAAPDFWAGDPILLPVPLHRSRQWRRRYNQSLELAREISRLTGVAIDPLLVRRTRPTRQQVGLGATQRLDNVAGAFAAAPDSLERTAGHRIIIIDDVITTGATVRAVARALRRRGVDQIDVMSFARVVFDEPVPT